MQELALFSPWEGNLKKMSMAVHENSIKQWGRRWDTFVILFYSDCVHLQRPTQPEDQLQRAQELLNAGKGSL